MNLTRKRNNNRTPVTFFLVSLGCAKNLVDSETVIDSLKKSGYTWVLDENRADVIVINTCCFIKEAKEEAIDTILEFVEKKKKRDFRIVAGGCLAQRFGDSIRKLIPEVDGWFGIDGCFTLPAIFEALSKGEKKSLIEKPSSCYKEYDGRERVTPRAWRYLKIAEGCSHHCTFCAIPPIRGPYRSRRIEDIVAEARRLAGEGCRELIIIAQDTGVYGSDIYGRKRLPELLSLLHEIDGIAWLRLLYINPHSLDNELISVMASHPKIVKYLDIPFQHSVESVLRKMGRPGGEETFIELLDRLRGAIPGVAVRSSFIVGFPGESAADFSSLCTFIQKARLNRAGFFVYSREEGTGAARLSGQLHHSTRKKRFREIMSLQQVISREVNSQRLGVTIPVMVDRKIGREDYNFLKGIAGELGNFLHTGELEKRTSFLGRTAWDAPDIDGVAFIMRRKAGGKPREAHMVPGEMLEMEVRGCTAYDVAGYPRENT